MNKDDIIRKIQALQQRTVAQGCTEAEAMSAARLAAKLLADHGLAMSDLEIEQMDCLKGTVYTGRKRDHEISSCVRAIGLFTDCRVWRTRGNGIKYHFFGFPEDVSTAKWLYGIILTSMTRELIQFKADSWLDDKARGRRQSHAFLLGMATRISRRLRDMKEEQDTETRETTGRELVVVKGAVVNQQIAKLGLNLDKSRVTQHSRDSAAYASGIDAGGRVGFGRELA